MKKIRVRVHLFGPDKTDLPSVEGLLISRRRREYLLAVPRVVFSAEAAPADLESKWIAIPRERVAFYEVIG